MSFSIAIASCCLSVIALRIILHSSLFTLNLNNMTVTKHYEDDHVMLYVVDGETETCITLDSDRQVERLAKCLTDLVRTDGRQVSIG